MVVAQTDVAAFDFQGLPTNDVAAFDFHMTLTRKTAEDQTLIVRTLSTVPIKNSS